MFRALKRKFKKEEPKEVFNPHRVKFESYIDIPTYLRPKSWPLTPEQEMEIREQMRKDGEREMLEALLRGNKKGETK